MKRVSVVCTVHEENGPVIAGLLAILDRIKPEVIFLEVPPAAFADYFDSPQRNLESHAVGRYRDSHPVDLVPVDLPTPSEDFFRNSRDLYERRSPEYCRLVDLHRQRVTVYGFSYLNSDYCSTHWSTLHETMLAAIAESADHRLAEIYNSWNRTKELREKAMMKNIEDYCRHFSFTKGAFLVGAAHRQPIIDLSRRQRGAASSTVQWDFAGFLDAPLQ